MRGTNKMFANKKKSASFREFFRFQGQYPCMNAIQPRKTGVLACFSPVEQASLPVSAP